LSFLPALFLALSPPLPLSKKNDHPRVATDPFLARIDKKWAVLVCRNYDWLGIMNTFLIEREGRRRKRTTRGEEENELHAEGTRPHCCCFVGNAKCQHCTVQCGAAHDTACDNDNSISISKFWFSK
jgi:hypothetical protein